MQVEIRHALSDDLDQLIRLHERELDAATWSALQMADFPSGLALPPEGEAGLSAYANMAAAFEEKLTLDDLAADYAAIYLNNRFSTSPYESVWLSDDHLACDRPMFELREIYAASGLKASDWRNRFDDHLVLQMQYLRHVLNNPAVDYEILADFMDEHLGYWFPDFAQRVSMQCNTAFYAALAELTHVWLQRFRELLHEISGQPIPSREVMGERIHRKLALDKAEIAPLRFMPGQQGASW